MVPRAGLLLLACVVRIDSYYYSLRQQHNSCGSAHYGTPVGSVQRLVVTYLSPGLADWNITVPMPPACNNAQVTGVDTIVCDSDVPPEVTMKELLSARVHRKGQLRGFATVNVTVHCILPSYSPQLQHPDTRSTYEVLSNELNSNEAISSEMTSHESLLKGLASKDLMPKVVKPTSSTVSNELTSKEFMPKVVKPTSSTVSNELTSKEFMPKVVKPTSSTVSNELTSKEFMPKVVKRTSSTVSPPPQEVTTPRIELTSPNEDITPPSKKNKRPKDIISQELEVTVKITPPSHESTKKKKAQHYEVYEPSSSGEENSQEVPSSQIPEFSTPDIMLPPRNSMGPPQAQGRRPHAQGRPPQAQGRSPRRPRMPIHHTAVPPYKHPGPPPPYRHVPASYTQVPPKYAAVPPEYRVIAPPYVVSPLFRPISMLRPRARIWRRPSPLMFFRYY